MRRLLGFGADRASREGWLGSAAQGRGSVGVACVGRRARLRGRQALEWRGAALSTRPACAGRGAGLARARGARAGALGRPRAARAGARRVEREIRGERE
jgi:hypothetical protein